jgi:hypothetical protein
MIQSAMMSMGSLSSSGVRLVGTSTISIFGFSIRRPMAVYKCKGSANGRRRRRNDGCEKTKTLIAAGFLLGEINIVWLISDGENRLRGFA